MEGEYCAATTDCMRKLMSFLSIDAYKPIVVQTPPKKELTLK